MNESDRVTCIYPGTYAADPAARPDLSPCQSGDIYLTVSGGVKIKSEAGWHSPAAEWADLANYSDAAKGAAMVGFLQTGPGAQGRTLQSKLRDSVDVRDYGAVGDGEQDDTKAIQSAIDASPSIEFPPGRYRITSTLTFPVAAPYGGGRWVGSGGLVGDPRTTSRDGRYSALVWNGPDGGTMIACGGTLGLKVEQLCFLGQMKARTGRAGILWHMQSHLKFGCGESTFEHCTFLAADVGVQCAEKATDVTAAGLTFIKCTFQSLARGLFVRNNQGLNYVFVHLSANGVQRVIHCERGGNVHVFGANFAKCGSASDFPITLENLGDNLAGNVLIGVRVEQNTPHLLECQGTGIVKIIGLTEAQANQNSTMFSVRGPKLLIEASRLVSNNRSSPNIVLGSKLAGHAASLVVRDCLLHAATWDQASWIGLAADALEAPIQVMQCTYGAEQVPIPDLSNSLEHGGYSCFVRTTGANTTPLAFHASRPAGGAIGCRISPRSLQVIELQFVGRSSDGLATGRFTRRATVSDWEGVTSLVAPLETVGADLAPQGWSVGLQVTKGAIVPQVRGSGNVSVDWQCTIKAMALMKR